LSKIPVLITALIFLTSCEAVDNQTNAKHPLAVISFSLNTDEKTSIAFRTELIKIGLSRQFNGGPVAMWGEEMKSKYYKLGVVGECNLAISQFRTIVEDASLSSSNKNIILKDYDDTARCDTAHYGVNGAMQY